MDLKSGARVLDAKACSPRVIFQERKKGKTKIRRAQNPRCVLRVGCPDGSAGYAESPAKTRTGLNAT